MWHTGTAQVNPGFRAELDEVLWYTSRSLNTLLPH